MHQQINDRNAIGLCYEREKEDLQIRKNNMSNTEGERLWHLKTQTYFFKIKKKKTLHVKDFPDERQFRY